MLESKQVSELIELGMNPNHLGFEYVCKGIKRYLDNPFICTLDKTVIYDDICKSFDVSRAKAGRTMRYSIDYALEYGDKERMNELFPGNIVPTNLEFIMRLGLYLLKKEYSPDKYRFICSLCCKDKANGFDEIEE